MTKINEICSRYDTNINGLTTKEANLKLEKSGLNELEEKKKKHPITIFLMQFVDILIILLIIAGIAAYFIGDWIDSIVILIVVILNAIIGFIQEYRAEKAMEKLKSLTNSEAVVKREGKISKIPAQYLTPGDIVIIEEGDKVPADLLLIESYDLRIDESALTGESKSVSKTANYDENEEININNLSQNESLQSKFTSMDSNVISGRGIGVVVATGMNTSIGKIAEMIQEDKEDTPLQIKVDKLGKILGAIAVVVCIGVFILEIFKGLGLVETFMTSVSIAVAAVPEGLPSVLTLTLALGMQKMAKSDAIVRKLLAVETLGSCNIVCSDKTGTLTLNKMTVRDTYLSSKELSYKISALCNNSSIKDGEVIGDPTDGAVLQFSQDNNYYKEDLEKIYPKIGEIPLDSSRKRMSTIHEISENVDGEYMSPSKETLICTKGAPEIVLDLCKYIDVEGTIKILDAETKNKIVSKLSEMTSSALRVLALGYKKGNYDNLNLENSEEIESELIFTGLVGMMDPPRAEAKKAIKHCQNAGIKVIMITGDHEDTASAIAKELGILKNGLTLTGAKLDRLSEEEYLNIVSDVEVYARVYPEQKMRIVNALKEKGNIVSMTGDGVNDAPALKKASIGVAMGSGTDIAKESADMVIQNDNFATIVKAIKEGRKIFDNIKRFVKFQVSTNVGAIFTIVGASLMNLPIPFNPIQILWINIIMDGPPAQSLGMEGAERDIMSRSPENGDLLTKNMLIKIIISGLVMTIGTLALFAYELNTTENINLSERKAMSMSFTIFVVFQLFNAINNRAKSNEKNNFFWIAMGISFLLQILVIYVPFLQEIFKTTGIGLFDWILIVLISLTIILSEQVMKRVIPE